MNFYEKVYEALTCDFPDWERFFTNEPPHTNELRKDFAIDSTDNRYEEYIMGEFNVATTSGDVKVYVVGVREVAHS